MESLELILATRQRLLGTDNLEPPGTTTQRLQGFRLELGLIVTVILKQK